MKRIPVEAIKTVITDFALVEGYKLKGLPHVDIKIAYRGSPFTDLKVFTMSFIYLENDCLLYSWGQIGLRL